MMLMGKYGTAFLTVDDLEPECISQVYECINNQAFETHMVIQADGHAGAGSIVGSTFPITDKVVPNTIGVDLGCGVFTVKLKDLTLNLESLDKSIRKCIPLGFNVHSNPKYSIKNNFLFTVTNKINMNFTKLYNTKFNANVSPVTYDYNWFLEKCKEWNVSEAQVNSSIGTLGSGNHFISIEVDSDNKNWLVVHTGSRNFGLKIAEYYQNMALNYTVTHGIAGNKDLAFLVHPQAYEYFTAMIFAQQFADLNRFAIIDLILKETGLIIDGDMIKSVHNFVDFEDGIVRKGAIRSYIREKMIIPMNMQYGSLICEGKSNPEYNYSAPHGAGRVMSRNKAKKNINLDDFKKQMGGIYSTSVSSATLDEAPDAYKPPHKIIDALEPTATIIGRLKTIYNLKSDDKKRSRGK